MTAPVFVRLRPSLHKVDLVTLDKVLTKALEDIRKAHTAGFTITVVSPDARTIKGRKRIAEALRHAGLEPEIVALLGWGTTYPGAEPPATPAALVEASAATEETTDDPTLTDEPSE